MTGPAARAGLTGAARLATLRRLYLYLVAFVCLLTLRLNAESVAADLGSVWASWTDPRLVARLWPPARISSGTAVSCWRVWFSSRCIGAL